MRALLVLTLVSALVACDEHVVRHVDGGDAGTGGDAGSAAVGGSAGDGGSSGSAGTSGTGGGAGSSGEGGSGGTSGGSGGVGGDCAWRPREIHACPEEGDRWYAAKTTLDVWWPGNPVRDPGRDDIAITMLARVTSCGADTEPTIDLKICDLALPVDTSEVECEAHHLTIPHAAWDSPQMPLVATYVAADAPITSDAFTLTPWTSLFGIDLSDRSTWPTAAQTGTFPCEGGVGFDCFPDHDQDTFDGITAHFRNDGATYVGPYDTGRCANTGDAYAFVAPYTSLTWEAMGPVPRAAQLRLGMRLGVGNGASGDCADNVGRSFIDVRVASCAVDPVSISSGNDQRAETMDYACIPAEDQFIDDHVPTYRVLAAGEVPGDSVPPLGWTLAGRDIDKSASMGTRASLEPLSTLVTPEPTCANARAAVFPND